MNELDELLYEGELVRYPGPWAFTLGRSALILVSDKELETLTDTPETVIDLSLTHDKVTGSLRSVCEQAQAAGHRTLIVAYDHFFHQYRPGQHEPRRLMPDQDDYIQRIGKLSRYAHHYGLGLELSLLSPLEIGPTYARATGESGLWCHYRKGLRDPKTGTFSVTLQRQTQWAHNKGIVRLADAGVRVFAFKERAISGTPYREVRPEWIVELTDGIQVEELVAEREGAPRAQIRVFGASEAANAAGLDRVLVVQHYKTPEMDYFSPGALPYLNKLVDRYADAGNHLNALYSDEMHIQQDWIYFSHHDNGQFALRYVTPNLGRAFAQRYGSEYTDFARWLVYFCYDQEDFAHDLSPHDAIQHVMGATPEAIQATALLRSRYYTLLQNGVVDLFTKAKRHAEKRMGHRLEARAHATWAESPTIDKWRSGGEPLYRHAYEYTSNFVWSNTVHQAASACHDYFTWGEFLTGNGTDHCECGWADRNYVGLQLASSLGILNDIPYAYSAHWGMPAVLSAHRRALENASGCAGDTQYGMVTGMAHREIDVLFLYPLDLVAAEERFGSWMTQYAYANLVPQAQLVEKGKVEKGAVTLAGRQFSTLVATFEPFPRRELLAQLRALAEGGGRVIWAGPPPLLAHDGTPIRAEWEALFGVSAPVTRHEGLLAPGATVRFSGVLSSVTPMTILTDFLVDHIYPVTPGQGAEVVARTKGHAIGTHRTLGSGTATFLGFRPRDDQSASVGDDIRTWFEVLAALGAYPGDDNTERLSRTGPFFCSRFPNGAVGIAPHFKHVAEDWEGGFGRDNDKDAAYLKRVPPPDPTLRLEKARVHGYTIDYTGQHCLTVRASTDGTLLAFAGSQARQITVNGKTTVFADRAIGLVAWAPVPLERQGRGKALIQLWVSEPVTLTLPVPGLPARLAAWAEGSTPGSRGAKAPAQRTGETLTITLSAAHANRWVYLAEETA